MAFEVEWKDILAYHHEQCEKHVNVIRYYFLSEKDHDLRYCYKRVLNAMVNQHYEYLKNYAFEKDIAYVKIDFKWIDDLHHKIDQLNEYYPSS